MLTRLSPALRRRIVMLLAGNAVLLVLIYASVADQASASDSATSWSRFARVLTSAGPDVAPLALAALGLTGIICAGAIDLSIGAIIAVAATVLGMLYVREWPPAVCLAGAFVTAVALSSFNGLLVRWLRIPAIIITLAGLQFYRGLALIVADVGIADFGGSLSVQNAVLQAPGRQYAGTILLVTAAAALLWERFGKLPRTWLAHGCSPTACRLHGIEPSRVLLSAYVAGGVFLGLAALLYATNRNTIEPARMALGFELQVIAAVVLGGTNIFGGEGSYAGTLLGAFFLYFVSQALTYADLSVYHREAFQGAVILAVIGIDCALHRKTQRMEELR